LDYPREKQEKKRKEAERLAANRRSEDDSGNFATSMAVGMATDNALLGYAVGGSLSGGMLGQNIADSFKVDTDSNVSSPSCDTSSSSFDGSSSSCDSSSSSFDSGSSGGFDSSTSW